MSKHTPGPWVVGNSDPLQFGKQQGNGTEPLGFVYGPSRPEASELGQQALANARLIAAAPELLQALEEADQDFEREGMAPDGPYRAPIRAAIAKAKGEQQ